MTTPAVDNTPSPTPTRNPPHRPPPPHWVSRHLFVVDAGWDSCLLQRHGEACRPLVAPQCAVRGRAGGQPWAEGPWASRRHHPRALGNPRRPHHVPAPAELAPEAGRGTLHKGTGLGAAAGEGVAFSRQRKPLRLKKKKKNGRQDSDSRVMSKPPLATRWAQTTAHKWRQKAGQMHACILHHKIQAVAAVPGASFQ